jgi:hypothetical protein
MLKLTLASACISMFLLVTAFAQGRGNTTGPYDPNQPMSAPDLQAPSPCAPDSSVARKDPAAIAERGVSSSGEASADTQCAERTPPSGPSGVTVEPLPPGK